MARLFVLSGGSIGESFQFDGTSVIGRSPEAEVTIAEASISRRHARLVPKAEPGLWGIVDLDSSNGVFVGGERVRKAKLRDGDTFRLGDVEFRLRDEAGDEAPADDLEFEDDLEFDEGPVDEAPVTAPPAPAAEDDGGFELEFGGDLDEAIAAPAPASAPRAQQPRPAAAPDRAGARASADRAARRQAAMGSAPRQAASGGPAASESGRPVLQYSKTRSGGTDISQLGGASKALVVIGAVLAVASAAYGAFLLTS